jgi:hypothetical protein
MYICKWNRHLWIQPYVVNISKNRQLFSAGVYACCSYILCYSHSWDEKFGYKINLTTLFIIYRLDISLNKIPPTPDTIGTYLLASNDNRWVLRVEAMIYDTWPLGSMLVAEALINQCSKRSVRSDMSTSVSLYVSGGQWRLETISSRSIDP